MAILTLPAPPGSWRRGWGPSHVVMAERSWKTLVVSPSSMPLSPASGQSRESGPSHSAHGTCWHPAEFPLLCEAQRGEGMCWGFPDSSGLEELAFPFWAFFHPSCRWKCWGRAGNAGAENGTIPGFSPCLPRSLPEPLCVPCLRFPFCQKV